MNPRNRLGAILSTTTFVLSSLLLFGCGAEGAPEDGLTFAASISQCGGHPSGALTVPTDDPAYCDAEVLRWKYHEASQTLTLSDDRILLNCCGDHGVKAAIEGEKLVVSESDLPESGDARCGCMCVFDYTVTIQDIPTGALAVRIDRHVPDQTPALATVFDGELDLTLGEGFVVISTDDASMWCNK